MQVHKMLSLDEETFKLADKLFGEGSFSEWVRKKILEEQQKEDSLEFLRKRIIDLTAEIEKKNAERALIYKRIELKLQQDEAEANRLLTERLKENKENGNEVELLQGKIGLIMQYQLKIKDVSREKSIEYAKRYISIPQEERPELKEFLKSEVLNK